MNLPRAQRSNDVSMNLVRIICLLLLAPLAVRAGGDEVVVLYNTRVPASRDVAEHYAAARHVPANQIFGFTLTTNEIITRADFTDFLQKPLADKLEAARAVEIWQGRDFGERQVAGSYGGTRGKDKNPLCRFVLRHAVENCASGRAE